MHVILMAVGDDKPGLTQALADAIVAAGGNWLESHFAALGGKYVGSVLVGLGADGFDGIEAATEQLNASGFNVSLVPADDSGAPRGALMRFEVVGEDRPGIVQQMSTALAALNVNIVDLETRAEDGPMSGDKLFRAKAKVAVPEGVSADAVQNALENISGEIMVDFEDGSA